MRFVAGRDAVAELLLARALWRKPSGISCWSGRRGEAVAGREPLAQRRACRSSEAELHREEFAAPRNTMRLHREANKRAQKEKGPEETLISLPSRFYLLPCEGATRHATRPNRRSPLAFTSGIHRRHAALAKLPLQLCRDCKEGCSKCKNCVELWEYGKDKGVTEYVLSV